MAAAGRRSRRPAARPTARRSSASTTAAAAARSSIWRARFAPRAARHRRPGSSSGPAARRGRRRAAIPTRRKKGRPCWRRGTTAPPTWLVAGGQFLRTAQGLQANGVEELVGGALVPLGSQTVQGVAPLVRSLLVWDDGTGPALYVGGSFSGVGGVGGVGGVAANGIARWDGTRWSALRGGLGTGKATDFVAALEVYNGALYAGGFFAVADGQPAANVARWDGFHWSAVGSGMDGIVHALRAWNGRLYAGGAFTHGGLTPHVAQWDGSAWSGLQAGVDGTRSSAGAGDLRRGAGGVRAALSTPPATFAAVSGVAANGIAALGRRQLVEDRRPVAGGGRDRGAGGLRRRRGCAALPGRLLARSGGLPVDRGVPGELGRDQRERSPSAHRLRHQLAGGVRRRRHRRRGPALYLGGFRSLACPASRRPTASRAIARGRSRPCRPAPTARSWQAPPGTGGERGEHLGVLALAVYDDLPQRHGPGALSRAATSQAPAAPTRARWRSGVAPIGCPDVIPPRISWWSSPGRRRGHQPGVADGGRHGQQGQSP